jgi:hypothetical protein
MTRSAWKHGVMGAVAVITQVLSLRLAVLVAISGGIWLTWVALAAADPFRLIALAIYGAGVVIPTVWLAGRS